MRKLLFILCLFPFIAIGQTNTFKWVSQITYTAAGTNTYTATIGGYTIYRAGDELKVLFTNANTGTATINVNSLGAINLRKNGSTPLASGDIAAGTTYLLSYDGTNFQVLNIPGAGSGGSSLPFADNLTLFQNNADATKTLAFDLAGISTATLRTVKWPNLNGKVLLSANAGSPFLTNVFDDFTIFNTSVGVEFNGVNNFSGELNFSGSSGTVSTNLFGSSTFSLNSDDTGIGGVVQPFLQFSGKNLRFGSSTSGTPTTFFHTFSTGIGLDEGARFYFTDNRTLKYGIEYSANGYVTNNQSLTDKQYVDGRVANAANITSGFVATARGGTGVDNSTGGTGNTFWARPNGVGGAATYRAIVAADIPTLNQNTTGTASNVTGIVAVLNGGTGTATPGLVPGTNITISGSWPNQTINATGGGGGTYYAPSVLEANATDANFTAVVNSIKRIPDGVATANRVITIPTGANGDVLELYNNEDTFLWTLTGATVYLADRTTVVTTLLYNVPTLMQKVDGLWIIKN